LTLDKIVTMLSKTYCISWDRVYQNSLDIDKQLSEAGLDYLMYNDSSFEELNDNWIRAEKVFFLGHLYNSMKDFQLSEHSIYILNAGDPLYPDYAGLTKKVEDLFESDPNIWAYSPSTKGEDAWSWSGSSIADSKIYPGLVLSTHTNAIWVALSRELVDIVLRFFEWMFETNRFDRTFKQINTGWGMDSFFCAMSICLGKKVYRDWKVVVEHDARTSYDHLRAMKEMTMTINESLHFFELLDVDRKKIKDLYNLMYKKVWEKQPLTVEQVYGIADAKDFNY